ncbi:serine/threonine-protein kinase [Streptomyces sp. B1866]|uniref:serine/threonine-protein kinase n=1 Tax=Streptomyces sp. B1866 TaxID=3075431 RepID=UPI0028921599|nr:serine/threonine-protein kinase [Streptomyces sp. B1866]MDT3399068.1 serine/threonine-protein kinase [Streptomyces sp. B1866]
MVGGRYRLVARLGHGGMGTVWRAHDEVVDREVAVKEPRVPDHLGERDRATLFQRMRREARAAARIDHPSVVTVHDVVVEDGRPWLVMELVRGHSLGDRLAEGTLDPREAARIGLAVLGALTAAHEAGVLHRDVKPDNVLLGRDDRVVLTDFGIAQVEGEQGLTETGAFVGSPEFIAPERVLGQRPGPESDLWSLGVVLYAAVEGMSPFRRSHTPATLQAVLSAEPQVPARGAGALGMLVMQLLRKDPAARPTAAEARETLEAVARPRPAPTALPLGGYGGSGGARGLARLRGPGGRRARLAAVGVVAALAAVLGLVLADPFADEGGLPAHWTVREEPEIVKASLALPEDYRRVVGSDGYSLTFHDPSGVFTVYLERVSDDNTVGTARQEAAEWKKYYEDGAESTMAADSVRSTVTESEQQGRPAADVITDYHEYGASGDDDIGYRQRDHVYVDAARKAYWRLNITMPAQGEARKDGDRLYGEVVRHLEIREP